MEESMILIAAAGSLSFCVIFLIFYRLIIKPVLNLINVCREIIKGNLNAEIKINSRTEIGELFSVFADMLEELKISRANLEEAKSILEIKVIARTQELSELIAQQEKVIAQKTKDLEERIKDSIKARAKTEEEKNTTIAVISSLVDGLFVFDKNNRLSFINHRGQSFFNIEPQEVTGKTLSDFKNIKQLFPLYNFLNGSLEPLLQKELELKEGLTVSVSVVPMSKGKHNNSSARMDNEKTGTLVIVRDISREKLVEKMKTEFVSLTAHQLRTPLSAIKWALRMLLDKDIGKINKEQGAFLERIYRSNERMIHLINDLLNVARIEEGRFLYQFTPIQLEELTASTINSFNDKIQKKKMKIKLIVPEKKMPAVKVDAEKIGIVIFNLLDNAIDYSSEKSKIEISFSSNYKEITFAIKDNGAGIPNSQKKRIFSKFFRGENVIKMETEGTGLGMFIAKNIIDAHHGKIWFESEEKKGTTFYFTLPIENEDRKALHS
jgi:signal transduction histidine kinase